MGDSFNVDGVADGVIKFPDIMESIRKAMASKEFDENSWVWLLLFAVVCNQSEKNKIVRCAECQYYDKRGAAGGMGWCSRPGAGRGNPEDFYCAGGKRKEES